MRKVTTRTDGTRSNERIYLGAFKIYREYKSDQTVTLNARPCTSLTIKDASLSSKHALSAMTDHPTDLCDIS